MKRYVCILVLLLTVLLSACTAFPSAPDNAVPTVSPADKPDYSAESLTMIVTEYDELAELRKYKNLKYLDLTGSECYDEIMKFITFYPQVYVEYTVPITGKSGTVEVSGNSELLTVPDGEYLKSLADNAVYLRKLTRINITDPDFDPEVLEQLRSAYLHLAVYFDFGEDVGLYGIMSTEIDLSALKPEDVDKAAGFISKMPSLNYVNMSSDPASADAAEDDGEYSTDPVNLLTFEQLGVLQQACPQAAFDYRFRSFDHVISTADENVEYYWAYIYDEGMPEIYAMMPYMTRLKSMYFQYCEIDYDVLSEFRDAYPDIDIVWRVTIGPYSARTDTEKILCSGSLNSDLCYNLRYCNKVKYLDLGHNTALTTIDFVRYMPELEVAIIAAGGCYDISPLAECKKLEYLEIFTTPVSDISCLAECTELAHLNMSYTYVRDLTPLYSCTKLERVWARSCYYLSNSERNAAIEALPDCEFNFTNGDPTQAYWRYDADGDCVERYALLREQFGYDNYDDAVSW